MNDFDLENFKKILLTLKTDLTEALEKSMEASKTVQLDQTSVGRLSRMDAMQSQAMAQESKRRLKQQLLKTEAALERIDEEEFGYCASCEEEIDKRRLTIDPATPFCVSCASRM